MDGDETTVARLDLAALGQFHQSNFRPDRAAWIAAGDVDPDRLAQMLDADFQELLGFPPSRPTVAKLPDELVRDGFAVSPDADYEGLYYVQMRKVIRAKKAPGGESK